ncbi:Branched-chain amino acid transport system / permease component [Micromonospora inyonensis]|uniref:Branched-chain amino acid transport system / permease component n=1 Tax=Micromonospora inyonensis TaxID=47866 RepID=A0A1C6SKL2_9ACTN|nr:Branched-chain amino acid transport system / permease component [Micromonospora inyonensis]
MTTVVDTEPGAKHTPSALAAVAASPRWLRYALLAAGLAVALWLPNGLYPAVAVDILCWALFAVSVDLLLGFTGLMSFGHAAFWGTSAYVTGLVAIHAGLPFPVAVLLGALAAAALAVPIGYLAVSRTGIYFAMVTLAFAQMVYYVANEWRSVTRGENGLQGVPRELFGLDLTDDYYFYYTALPIALLGLAAAWRIVHSPFGRVLVGIRDNPARARALGYPVRRYKLTAFVLSGFIAGLGGRPVRRGPPVRLAGHPALDHLRQGGDRGGARRHRHPLGRRARRDRPGAAGGLAVLLRLRGDRPGHRWHLRPRRAAVPAGHLGHRGGAGRPLGPWASWVTLVRIPPGRLAETASDQEKPAPGRFPAGGRSP